MPQMPNGKEPTTMTLLSHTSNLHDMDYTTKKISVVEVCSSLRVAKPLNNGCRVQTQTLMCPYWTNINLLTSPHLKCIPSYLKCSRVAISSATIFKCTKPGTRQPHMPYEGHLPLYKPFRQETSHACKVNLLLEFLHTAASWITSKLVKLRCPQCLVACWPAGGK